MSIELAEQFKRKIYDDYKRAIELLYHVVINKWDRFDEIEVIALMELNAILPRAKAAGVGTVPFSGSLEKGTVPLVAGSGASEQGGQSPSPKKDSEMGTVPIDPRLVKLLDLDVRIVLTWDADLTDIDLHVIEPSNEKAFYGHNRTTIGGAVSRDFTQGYGPEEYILRKAMGGTYKIQTNYYGSTAQTIQGPVTLQVDVFTNFGRANEKRRSIVLRLSEKKETVDIGEMEF